MSKLVKVSRSQLAESFFYLNGQPLSLLDYPHMRLIYDITAKNIVLKFSRQCVYDNQRLDLASGQPVLAKDLKPGQKIIGFNTETLKNEVTTVANVWDNGITHIYEIRTRTGRKAIVTDNHPFWKVDGWCEAKDLKEGDLIALSKDNSCSLSTIAVVPDCHYKIAAYLLAEGSTSTKSIGFTTSRQESAEDLQLALSQLDSRLILKALPTRFKYQYRITGDGVGHPSIFKPYLLSWNLWGKNSQTKVHPDFVWDLTKEQIQDYLRIWWDTDGYVSTHKNGHYYPGISLISEHLIKGIQTLLLKLGIHSTIHEQVPKIYQGTNKVVYKLAIEGNESKQRFFNLIKTYKNPAEVIFKEFSNNQQLVIDSKFVGAQLKTIKNKRQQQALYFDKFVKYYTLDKVKRILDKSDLPELQKIIDSDIYFDKVKEVNYLGKHSTTGIEINKTHTFQIDHLQSKNTAKSTTMSNIMLADAITRPKDPNKGGSGGFQQMYVSPTVDQTKIFSHDRLTPAIDGSPWVKKHFIDSRMVQNVFMKQLKNGSKMYLRYALLNADRLRGFSVDKIYYDECQDLREEIMPVADQSMSRSYYKERVFSGTPKLTKGTLANLWYRSTMNEYMPKCEHCNKWNILDEKNIGKKGLICKYCGKGLNPRNGQWVRTAKAANDKYKTIGFRVCALHFYGAPWVDWQQDIILKYETEPRNIFFNETLGLEYDDGVSPLTEADIRKCCDENWKLDQKLSPTTMGSYVFMGVDYGPINSNESYTVVLVLCREQGQKIRVVTAKRYIGKEADFAFIHNDLTAKFGYWHASAIGADHGMGEATNSELRSRLGIDKVIAFQHQANQKEELKWNAKLNAFTTSRTQIMTRFFSDIKKGRFIFPNWEEWEPFAQDLLAPAIDYDKDKTRMFYVNNKPDDTLHALIYGVTAMDLVTAATSW